MSSQQVAQWTFDCKECDFESHENTESEALNAASNHADFGTCEWNFEITNPDGEVVYP